VFVFLQRAIVRSSARAFYPILALKLSGLRRPIAGVVARIFPQSLREEAGTVKLFRVVQRPPIINVFLHYSEIFSSANHFQGMAPTPRNKSAVGVVE
jgi:hypothetical protein